MAKHVQGMVTTEQLAELFEVTPLTITRWWQAKQMPKPMRMGRRILRFRVDEINAWIEGGCKPLADGVPRVEPVPTNK